MKKIAITSLLIMTFVLAPITVGAATVNDVNDESVVNIVASWIFNLLVRNNNIANITNNIASTANTGGNSVVSADDMSGTVIVTGDAMAGSTLENNANNNVIDLAVESAEGTSDLVEGVNDESEVNIETNDTLEADIENNNDVTVDNNVTSDSTSGDNLVDSGDDLDDTIMRTGFAGSVTGVSNLFNMDVLQIVRTIRLSIL